MKADNVKKMYDGRTWFCLLHDTIAVGQPEFNKYLSELRKNEELMTLVQAERKRLKLDKK